MTLEQIAEFLKVNKSTVLWWERRRVPAERVLAVADIVGVPAHELRPDIYPEPVEAAQ